MNVRVDVGRFLSVACDPEERIVFDRQENKYHLLRESAARLWDEIGEGGTFALEATESETPEADPIAQLREAGILEIAEPPVAEDPANRISRRSWMGRTGKVAAAAVVLPLVATVTSPSLILGNSEDSVTDMQCSLINAESSDGMDSSGDGESSGDDSGVCGESGEDD